MYLYRVVFIYRVLIIIFVLYLCRVIVLCLLLGLHLSILHGKLQRNNCMLMSIELSTKIQTYFLTKKLVDHTRKYVFCCIPYLHIHITVHV